MTQSSPPSSLDLANLRSLWSTLLVLYPTLSVVHWESTETSAEMMQFIPGPPPILYFPENAPLDFFEKLRATRPISFQLASEKLGIESSTLTPEILRSFIFLHECGHAHDFVVNFAGVSSPDHPEQSLPRFEEACMRCNERQDFELKKLPIPVTPSGFNASRVEYPDFLATLVAEYLKKEAVTEKDLDAVYVELEHAYKNLPSEVYADDFAKKFLNDHNLLKSK
jgi:hypothetical protein